jgi:prepilin-type N-terminal cleavage/methylation domain-containing protein
MNRKGFTLIELLIVVVIIGILAAIAIPKFANTKQKAVVASMKSDLRNLVTAQEAFFSDNNDYAGHHQRRPVNGRRRAELRPLGNRWRWFAGAGTPITTGGATMASS